MITKVNAERLQKRLEELGEIGAEPGKGRTRMGFSPEYLEGAELVCGYMREAGMEDIRIDAIGNIIGVKKGKTQRKIVLGSHIDTIPEGGVYDGCLGVLGAIECIQTLTENNITPNHTIEVVSFSDEEGNIIGGLVGSKSYAGIPLTASAIAKLPSAGITEVDIASCKTDTDLIDCYLELHIEQGGVLDTQQMEIGVVQAIVGIKSYNVTVEGFPNHAGTTPMFLRDDALVKAAEMITEVNKIVRELDPDMVGTVGEIYVEPGASNIVPGRVKFPMEFRAVKTESLDKAFLHMKEKFIDYDVSFEPRTNLAPTFMSDDIKQVILSSSEKLGYKALLMNSGAGHDTMSMAEITKVGMIFAPSVDGISHSPKEFTHIKDVENSTNVLLHTVLELDEK